MELNEFPNDIDYDRYTSESCLILNDVGITNTGHIEKLKLYNS